MTRNQADCENAYENAAESIVLMAKTIEDSYTNKPARITWGTVGDANHIVNLLSVILEFIGTEAKDNA